MGNQGGAWEAVFAGAEVSRSERLAGADQAAGPEYARRDDSLSLRPEGPVLATAQWPTPERPSLDRPIWVFIPRSPDTFVVYDQERRWRRWRSWR